MTSFLLLGLHATGQASSQDPQASEEEGRIRGTVVDAVTHAPIARALVYSPDNRFATLTDANGHFEFSIPESSAAKIDTNADTRVVSASAISLSSPDSAGYRVSLSARKPGFLDDPSDRSEVQAAPNHEVTILLTPEALITGRVTLSTGDAALGVTVQLFSRQVQDGVPRWRPKASARANSAGEFRFADLPPDAYKLITQELPDNDPVDTVPGGGQRYGFPPFYYPGVADFAAAGTIQLGAGQTFHAELSLARQPYYNIKIPVANAENIPGMSVSVQGQHGSGYSLGYNSGTHRIEGWLPNGNYVVEAVIYGPIVATGSVNIRVGGGPVEGPTLSLARNGSINLNVKEEFNNTASNGSGQWSDGKHTFSFHGPRSYLQARLESADDVDRPNTSSIRPPNRENDDSLVLENVAPGRYWLRLTTSQGYVASATIGAVDLLQQPLVVGSGVTMTIEVEVRDDGAEIDGTVANMAAPASSTGAFSSHAWVYFIPLPDSPGQFLQLGVSVDGKFDSQMMAPGAYRILAFAAPQPNLPYRSAEDMRDYESKGEVIHLAAGQKATLHVHLIPPME